MAGSRHCFLFLYHSVISARRRQKLLTYPLKTSLGILSSELYTLYLQAKKNQNILLTTRGKCAINPPQTYRTWGYMVNSSGRKLIRMSTRKFSTCHAKLGTTYHEQLQQSCFGQTPLTSHLLATHLCGLSTCFSATSRSTPAPIQLVLPRITLRTSLL